FNPNNLATVSIWVEDDNDKTTTKTGFKSFTGTPDGNIPGTTTPAPLLWIDQEGRKVDAFFEQFDDVFDGNVNHHVLVYRSRPSLIEVQSSIDRPILRSEDRYQTFSGGNDQLNIVQLAPSDATLDTYSRAVDTFNTIGAAVLHRAGDAANYLGGEAAHAGDPVVVVDAGVLKLKLTDGTHAAMPGLDGVLPANVMHYTADSGGVVRYKGGELVFNEFTLQKVMVYQTDEHGDPVVDEFGQPVQVQATRAAGEPVLHYFGERQYHVTGERVEYLGDEPVFGQSGQQVKDVLNKIILHQAGEPVLAGQPVIVREGGVLKLVLQGGARTAITPTTVLPANVLRYASTDAKGQVFYLGGEPVYYANTDPVQANRQFGRLQATAMSGEINWAGVDSVNLTLGDGANYVSIESTHAGSTTVNLGGGADTARVKSISGATTINAGDGDDVIDVYNDDARLYGINAVLTINGDGPSASDTLNIVNTFDFAGTAGTLAATTLSGLGMGGSIVYGTVESLNLSLGVGNDHLEVLSTAAGAQTNIFGDQGDDTVTVRATGGTTNILLGEGVDTVAVTGAGSHGLQSIQGALNVTADADAAGDGQNDSLNITDTTAIGKLGALAGTLTATTLTGLEMAATITYGGFEFLNLALGEGADKLTVQSTMAGSTAIRGGTGASDGGDTIKVETLAGEVAIRGGAGNDAITLFDGSGDTAALNTHLVIDGEAGADTITLNLGRRTGLAIDVADSGPKAGNFDNLFVNGTAAADAFFLGAGDKDLDISAGVLVVGQKLNAAGQPLYYVQATFNDEPQFDADGLPLFELDAAGHRVETTVATDFPVLLENPSRDTVRYLGIEKLTVDSLGGDDVFQVDDNAVATEIRLGDGADVITIATVATTPDEFNVPVVNFEKTTRGTSASMSVFGGAGNDEFDVNHNEAELFLFGEDGDDVFAVFTFLVLKDEADNTVNFTTLDGGTGNNSYEYLQNAPVHINGGPGKDTLIITGTPIADVFIVTDKFIAGAGRQVLIENNIE